MTTTASSNDIIFEKIREILTQKFSIPADRVIAEASLRGTLGLDSLDLVDLIYYMQEVFGVTGRLEDYRDVTTMNELCGYISERQDPQAS